MRQVWRSLSVTKQGALVLMVPTAVTLLSLAAWNWSRQQEQQAANWVIHTEEVLKESNQLLTSLIDAETELRGYGLTRNLEFLEPYEQTQASVFESVEKLTALTVDNPSQQVYLKIVRREAADYLAFLDEMRRLIDEMNRNEPLWRSPQIQAQFSQGKADMEALQGHIENIRAEERSLLAVRRETLSATKHLVDWVLITSISASLSSYGIAFYLYSQADQKIITRNRELMTANESLSKLNVALARRNQDLDDFTHTVSHDLKAPLRAIHNLADWLIEDLDLLPGSESRKHADLLHQRVNKMQSLIDGLLAYSRADRITDPTGANAEFVNVAQLVQELVKGLDMPPQFRVVIAPDLPTIKTERILLQQVFSNLITNAYKHHTRKSGKIAIAAELAASAQPKFTVSDDGPGIAPEYREHIFKIFQTGKSHDSTSSGIGLSIVKKIVERRGGELGFTSTLGEGTTFYFTWP
ncbi:MAG: CHASE3 domain-containing protein [Phormidesmis sp.]